MDIFTILSYCLLIFSLWIDKSQCTQSLVLAEMKQCPGKENLIILGSNFTIKKVNNGRHIINGEIILTEPLTNGFKGKLIKPAYHYLCNLNPLISIQDKFSSNYVRV